MLSQRIRRHNSDADTPRTRGMAEQHPTGNHPQQARPQGKQQEGKQRGSGLCQALIATCAVLGAASASAMPNPNALPAPMPGQSLLFPAAGVVCDRSAQSCYDSSGLSLGLTRQYFGAYAEQNVLRNLNGQAPPRQFRLSNGEACDVNQRLCWSDGWAQRSVDRQLSQQLFGNSGGGSNATTSTGLCRLNQGFRTLYSGACDLRELSNDNRRRFVVKLGNGARYTFEDRGNGYRISDGMGGNWPVSFNDQGRSAVFRWADMNLSVTQNAYQGSGAAGRALGNLLEALFN